MSDPTVNRRLVAVFAADVEGYSRLMGDDEVGTLKGLTERRAVLDRLIGEHRGRIANTAGDSVLAEFGSAVEAVQCAVEAQTAMADANSGLAPDRRINFRIGVHIGDVMVRAGDLFGDGVNIAARLQTLARPGGVCISGATYDQVHKVMPITFGDLGTQRMKNIQEPIKAYQVNALADPGEASASLAEIDSPPALPDKPSIAVLPFQNMSGDPEQEYFADGMVEEIITALSRFKSLFVIARNSSFTFKGRAVDVKEVGYRLGVRYVLEGSVRKASDRVRITGQLIDAVSGAHIWADKFERDYKDIFSLQDEVTAAVVSAIHPKLLQTEIETSRRRRPDNLTAYEFFLRMMPNYYLSTREGMGETIRLARRALELDPRYGFVAAVAGACHVLSVISGYSSDPKSDRAEAVRLARLALAIDDDDAEKLAFVAATLALNGDCDDSVEIADRSIALNPNSFHAWHGRGTVYRIAGFPEEAVRSQNIAIRLSPVDPLLFQSFNVMGLALIELGRYDEAVQAAKRALRLNPSFLPAHYCLTSALANLGQDAEAQESAGRLLELDPGFTISARVAGRARSKWILEGLRKTGLPE
ncbi:adenylate/guanylate cyclase domain-containing protein [Bradyrhizobium jicamae]|uniref:Adenylate/guanylate cyclase domain-containing protein n=1 Tax=Bradyrhizobium jicamae TaxID=280332 RepID=A0ABS5FV41_9BRAD|nr:adenylate/guanylate cyclase domain-containing protein [Bradyrhizobium jicamae]MBR0800638.1 adenylate/guanylate cyclase domain-containing protein [Bradyrhizobium jicamae]MBR0933059.1 adenylate/guanylate cyclase domain-containing protein [Bradyrhizobium jicamae]